MVEREVGRNSTTLVAVSTLNFALLPPQVPHVLQRRFRARDVKVGVASIDVELHTATSDQISQADFRLTKINARRQSFSRLGPHERPRERLKIPVESALSR